MLTVAESYFESDDFSWERDLSHRFPASASENASFALNAARIVSCVLTTVPMLSPGILSLVSDQEVPRADESIVWIKVPI